MMKIAPLAMTLLLALGVAGSATAAPLSQQAADQAAAVSLAPQDAPVAQIAQAQDAPASSPGIDVNVDVTRGSDRAWFASPIWIAIFVLGGLLLLVLVAMAARGGGGQPQTIVK